MLAIQGVSLAEVWEKSVQHFFDNPGTLLDSEVGGPFYEIQNVIMCATSPLSERRVSANYSYPDLLKNARLDGTGSKETTRIMQRITKWPLGGKKSLDQMRNLIASAEANLFTRRAVITLWHPQLDRDDPSAICPSFLQVRVRRNEDHEHLLDLTLIVRSSDAWVGAPFDMLLFSNLQSDLADKLSVRVGSYVHHVVSYHMYQQDYGAASLALGGRP